MIWLMRYYSKKRSMNDFEFCSMFHYDVAMMFVYELVYYKIAPKTFMINAMLA